jgi:hypothetical protein
MVALLHVVEQVTGSKPAAAIAALVISSLVAAAWTWVMFHTAVGDRFARWLATLNPSGQRSHL